MAEKKHPHPLDQDQAASEDPKLAERLGEPSSEFTAEEGSRAATIDRGVRDEDGYVDPQGHMQPHQRPAEVEEPFDIEADQDSRDAIEELRNIHDL